MRSGMVAIVGRPNVGKSSLVNALVGRKISIVTPKPQTTRHQIQGVLNLDEVQIVFVDTPGLHRRAKQALNKRLNEVAEQSLDGVDVVLFVVEAGRFTDEDEAVLALLARTETPVGLIVNKIDKLRDRAALLPLLQTLSSRGRFEFVVPLSAMKRDNLQPLVEELTRRMPEGPALYPEDQIVGHDSQFSAAETVREKLMTALHEEVPYAVTVAIEAFEIEGQLTRISAVIWVAREGQKKIVIGEGGATLKSVGMRARKDLERQFGGKVFLKLWVRVKEGWTDDPRALAQFGYTE